MSDILTKLPGIAANAMSNPYGAIAAAIIAVGAFFLLRKYILPWVQKYQNMKNASDVKIQHEKSQADNIDANDQLDAIMEKINADNIK